MPTQNFWNRLAYNQDAGVGDAPSGYGDMYDRLFANNPYRNLNYKKSMWQNFLSMLGFRTDYDRWAEDVQVNSNEYDASIFQMMQQNDYNDSTSQAERMRAAGMNPDLLGTDSVAEAASPGLDVNGMPQNIGDEFSQFGESVMGIIARSIAGYKDFLSLGQMSNIIDAGNIDNAQNMIGFIDNLIESSFNTHSLSSQENFDESIQNLEAKFSEQVAAPWEMSYAKRYGFSQRQRKAFDELYLNRLHSLITDKNAWTRMKERNEALSGSFRSQSDPFYSPAVSYDETIGALANHLSELNRTVLKLQAENAKRKENLTTQQIGVESSQASLDQQYLGTMIAESGGTMKAQSELSTYDANIYVKRWESAKAQCNEKILNTLQTQANSGNQFAKHMLINWTLDNMVKYNFNIGATLSGNLGLSFIGSR